MNLTLIPSRCIGRAKMNFLRQGFGKLSYYSHRKHYHVASLVAVKLLNKSYGRGPAGGLRFRQRIGMRRLRPSAHPPSRLTMCDSGCWCSAHLTHVFRIIIVNLSMPDWQKLSCPLFSLYPLHPHKHATQRHSNKTPYSRHHQFSSVIGTRRTLISLIRPTLALRQENYRVQKFCNQK